MDNESCPRVCYQIVSEMYPPHRFLNVLVTVSAFAISPLVATTLIGFKEIPQIFKPRGNKYH